MRQHHVITGDSGTFQLLVPPSLLPLSSCQNGCQNSRHHILVPGSIKVTWKKKDLSPFFRKSSQNYHMSYQRITFLISYRTKLYHIASISCKGVWELSFSAGHRASINTIRVLLLRRKEELWMLGRKLAVSASILQN